MLLSILTLIGVITVFNVLTNNEVVLYILLNHELDFIFGRKDFSSIFIVARIE